MIYLLLGDDRPAKEQRIAKIKTAWLPSNNALKFDYEPLDAAELGPDELKKALLALPAVARKRLILIRAAEKLDDHNKEMILAFIGQGGAHAALVLDSDERELKGQFFAKVMAEAEVVRCISRDQKPGVWEATDEIKAKNPAGAIMILNDLIDGGEAPVKIMGALVWFWGDLKNRLSAGRFKKGLLVLQEADLNIKRSRLNPAHAIEIAVTKLSSLIAC